MNTIRKSNSSSRVFTNSLGFSKHNLKSQFKSRLFASNAFDSKYLFSFLNSNSRFRLVAYSSRPFSGINNHIFSTFSLPFYTR